ncbi:MAG: YhjD/YihY/BrkB family envelope integrity protein [Caldilineaceae bacterium]
MNLQSLRQHRMANLAQLTMQEWFADNTSRHAAALTYYTIFAISPLLMIVFSIAGAIYGYDVAQTSIVALVRYYIPNPGVAEMIQTVLANSIDPSSNLFLTFIGVLVVIYGATSVFSELQSALNIIWDAPLKTSTGIGDFVRNRLFAIVMVFSGGLVLFVSLLISTVLAAVNQWTDLHFHVTLYSEWIVFLSLFAISTVIFALIYKFVPDVAVAWHDVLIGAIATGLLFSIARMLINLSLRYTSLPSIFGATGSLVVFLVWVYYSAMIFFLGAEFTQVYGRTYGSRWREELLLEETVAEEKPPIVETETGILVPEDVPLAPTKHEEEIITLPFESALEHAEQQPQAEEQPKPKFTTVVRERLQQGAHRVQEGAKALRKVPGVLTSPIGDIAIGVAVVGAISVTGLLFEPWRRKQKEKKSGDSGPVGQ